MGTKELQCMYVCVCLCVCMWGLVCMRVLRREKKLQLCLLNFCNLPSILIKKKQKTKHAHKYIFTKNDWTQQKGGRGEHVGVPPTRTRRKRQEIKFAFAFDSLFFFFLVFFLFLGYVDITKSGILHTHNLSR